MADVASLVEEIADVAKFLASRRGVADPSTTQKVTSDMADSMCNRIMQLPKLLAKGASELSQALEASGYDPAGKVNISAAIDSRLSMVEVSQKSNVRNIQQLLINICVFLTALDWDKLMTPTKDVDSKTLVLVHRLARLGLTHLHEQTTKWCVAVLVIVGFERFPKYREIYALVNSFKEAMGSAPSAFPFPRIVVYPNTPQELPAPVYKYAYDDDDPPIVKPLARLSQVGLHHIPLRKNSKLLVDEAKRDLRDGRGVPQGDSPGVSDEARMMGMLRRMLLGGDDEAPHIDILQPPRRRGHGASLLRPQLGDIPAGGGGSQIGIEPADEDSQLSGGAPRAVPLTFADQQPAASARLPDQAAPAEPSTVGNALGRGRHCLSHIGGFVPPKPLSALSSMSGFKPPGHVAAKADAAAVDGGVGGATLAPRVGKESKKKKAKVEPKPEPADESDDDGDDGGSDDSDESSDDAEVGEKPTPKAMKVPPSVYEKAGLTAMDKRTSKRAAAKKDEKAKAKAAPKTKAGPKAMKLKTEPKSMKVKSESKKGSRPSFSVEWTRNQALCRTGVKGDPSHKIKFEDVGGCDKAVKKAKKWVADQCKSRGLD